jgi:1-deoxy-D-xylulose-5-phosphate synthase
MSISKNTGAFAAYLSRLRASRRYHKAKTDIKTFLEQNPAGEALSTAVSISKKFVKNALYYQGSLHGNFFEEMGFKYYGIVDGHNLRELLEVLELAKMIDSPCLIHVKTKKGKGFKPAEENSGEYHAAMPAVSCRTTSGVTCSEVFGREITRLAERDKRIVLISAAMKYATGCNYFNDRFPQRFYDCGIAEGHAATFAAGLASQGALPVFAVYSTFAQRSFDRLIHDCAIEKQHVVLAIDRAGVVGEDGETHQGVFDVAMLAMIPGFAIYSPANAAELRKCLYKALYEESGPVAVRYPRGEAADGEYCGLWRLFARGSAKHKLIVTYGRMTEKALEADSDVLQLVKIKPLPEMAVKEAANYGEIVFYEEGIEQGGIGQAFLLELVRFGWRGEYEVMAVTGFIPPADVEAQLRGLIS